VILSAWALGSSPTELTATENGIGHPSSVRSPQLTALNLLANIPSQDLILAIIKFAATHYASRGQLRPRHNKKIAKSDSKGTEDGQNPSGPSGKICSFVPDDVSHVGSKYIAPAKHLTKFLTMDRAFDATAAHAIGASFATTFA